MKTIKTKKQKPAMTITTESTSNGTTQPDANYAVLEKASLEDVQKIRKAINKIKKQNSIHAMFARRKNELALAENQETIVGIIKNMLNWLTVITSAEMVRKDEYDTITNQLLQLDEDVNGQLDTQVKFKKAYQNLIKLQDVQKLYMQETDRLKKENLYLKIISAVSIVLAFAAIIISAS